MSVLSQRAFSVPTLAMEEEPASETWEGVYIHTITVKCPPNMDAMRSSFVEKTISSDATKDETHKLFGNERGMSIFESVKELKADAAKSKSDAAESKSEIRNLKTRAAKSETDAAESKSEIRNLKARAAKSESDAAKNKSDAAKSKSEIRNLKAHAAKSETEATERKSEIANLEAKIEELTPFRDELFLIRIRYLCVWCSKSLDSKRLKELVGKRNSLIHGGEHKSRFRRHRLGGE